MFQPQTIFSGFSVNDEAVAKQFYRHTLGLEVEDGAMGLGVHLPDGGTVFVYQKPDHQPASFTVLNFVVADIDEAVDELGRRGVSFEHYDGMYQDERGISRGRSVGRGPDIAWFKDPAGNILAVLQDK